jgi:RHS repeat-associated protein
MTRPRIGSGEVDTYTWDYRNRLSSIVTLDASNNILKTVGYEYDVDDQRVKKTVTSTSLGASDGVVENYYLDRNQIAFVTDSNGNEMFHYLYGLNVDSVLAQDSSTGMVWSLSDRLGSIDLLTDKDGVVVDKRSFDSFGRLISQSNPTVSFRYGYTGRELDLESGLHYYRARYYDSNVGRFISVDPIGFDAGDTNLYRYVFNSSTNHTDPSGKIVPLLAAFLVGGLAAGAAGAAIGGITGFARSLANAYDNGEELSWGTIGNALGEGVKGAAIGGAVGFAVGGVLAATAVASPFVTAAAGTGLAIKGFSDNATSAFDNFQQGRYASAAVDTVSALFDIKSTRDGISNTLSTAKSGKWYNKPNDWDGVARTYVNQQRDNNSGVMWNLMTLAKAKTIGYEMGDTMLGGRIAGMGPGAAYRGEFKQLSLFPEPPMQLELDLFPATSPQEYIANYPHVGGSNPNSLIAYRVGGNPSNREGVYIKLHHGKVKVGSAGGAHDRFNNRYSGKDNGGAEIEIEIPQTRTQAAVDDSSSDYKWSAKRQRRFDEAYIDALVPQEFRYRATSRAQPEGVKPVSQENWTKYRHIFGYGSLPENFIPE